jgi:hypothetical protein
LRCECWSICSAKPGSPTNLNPATGDDPFL